MKEKVTGESEWLFLGCLLCFTTLSANNLPANLNLFVVFVHPVALSLLQPYVPVYRSALFPSALLQPGDRKISCLKVDNTFPRSLIS
ncbi:hypothetical protein FPOAC1_011006 [Fusarium poae]|uniref:hypothetical protein n=1 Tax=Fusarium poae TaxID=36050 RepID=UPI001CE89535|nr:hypothetical protein FPOAC1_011006 [Fusarium poae]KAG8666203.1 hypothetical protein FPOAC1_011006 [Fusarium poae]